MNDDLIGECSVNKIVTHKILGKSLQTFTTIKIASDLEKFGIDTSAYQKALEGDVNSIDTTCLDCIRALENRDKVAKERPHAISNKEVIGDALIEFLVGVLVECVSVYELKLPYSLNKLIKLKLGFYKNKILNVENAYTIKFKCALAKSVLPNYSDAKIAKLIGVNKSTVSRWITEDEEFQSILKDFQGENTDKIMPDLGMSEDEVIEMLRVKF